MPGKDKRITDKTKIGMAKRGESAYQRPIDKNMYVVEKCGSCAWSGTRGEVLVGLAENSSDNNRHALRCPKCEKVIKIVDEKDLWKNVSY